MIEQLYDNFFHIDQACFLLKARPNYRTIISAINCALSNYTLIRLVSFFSILMSIYFCSKIFFNKFRPLYLCVAFHPIVFFPVLYASQISSSLTLFWACLTLFIISLFEFKRKKLYWSIPLLILLSLAGHGLRDEAIFYIPIISLSYCGHALIENKLNIKKTFHKNTHFIATTISFVLMYFLLGEMAETLFSTTVREPLASAPTQHLFYPEKGFFSLQVYSNFIYFINFLIPAGFTFFGPWDHWSLFWHNDLLNTITILAFIFFLFLLTYLIFKAKSKALQLLGYFVFIFFIYNMTVSFFQRTDWYFPGRAYFSTLLLVLGVAHTFLNYFKDKRIYYLTCSYLVASLLIQQFFHFHNYENFLKFEYRMNAKNSAKINVDYAKFIMNEKPVEAYNILLKAHSSIKDDHIIEYVAPRNVWLISLQLMYYIGARLGDQKSTEINAKRAMRSESYYSTSMCLAEKTIPIEKCLTPRRVRLFCNYIQSIKSTTHSLEPFSRIPYDSVCKPM